MEDERPRPLNYQSTDPSAPPRRPRVRPLWYVVGAAVVAAVLVGLGSRDRIRAYLAEREFRRQQDACRADAPPADAIAYEDDVTRAAALDRKPGYITISGWDHRPRVGRAPRAWFDLRYRSFGGWQWAPDDPILFLHELKLPSGAGRLVVVHGRPLWPGRQTRVEVHAMTLRLNGPVAFDATLLDRSYDGVELVDADRSAGAGLRIFAGQLDPNDASKFTIGYEIDGVRGTIDGQLVSDGAGGATVVTSIRP